MSTLNYNPRRVWTIAQAKARLSEVLRLAEEEGPQHIGTRRPFVVVPASDWYAKVRSSRPMGQWLVDNMPRGLILISIRTGSPGERSRSRLARLNERLSRRHQRGIGIDEGRT